MSQIKLTKNELRLQEYKLKQLERYLPTLQLKKAMLQAEVFEARLEIEKLEKEYKSFRESVIEFEPLLSTHLHFSLTEAVHVENVQKHYENIAGIDVPFFESINFVSFEYDLFETPPWVDVAVMKLRGLTESLVKVKVAEEKKSALEEELRQVSIRVNLFEKILIPRAKKNIKKIKVFLGDQELSAVSQVKVAKNKIEERKSARLAYAC